jgi:hypothetical protein
MKKIIDWNFSYKVKLVSISFHYINFKHLFQKFPRWLVNYLNLLVSLLKHKYSPIAREDLFWLSILINLFLEVNSVE